MRFVCLPLSYSYVLRCIFSCFPLWDPYEFPSSVKFSSVSLSVTLCVRSRIFSFVFIAYMFPCVSLRFSLHSSIRNSVRSALSFRRTSFMHPLNLCVQLSIRYNVRSLCNTSSILYRAFSHLFPVGSFLVSLFLNGGFHCSLFIITPQLDRAFTVHSFLNFLVRKLKTLVNQLNTHAR